MVRLIRELLQPYRWLLVIVLAAMLMAAAISLAGPWPLKIIIDSVISNHPLPPWTKWFAPMPGSAGKMRVTLLAAMSIVLIAVLSAIANYIATYFVESIGQSVANDLRIRTYHHLQRLSLGWHRTHQVGTMLSTITTDVSTIQSFASASPAIIFVNMTTIIGMLIVMFTLRWDFALIAVGLLPFLVFGASRVRNSIQKTAWKVREIEAEMVATAQEGLDLVEVVQAFDREDLEEKRLAQISRLIKQVSLRARRVRSLLGPVVTIPIAMCSAFVLWRGTSLILAGTLTLGTLTVITAYLGAFFALVHDLSSQTDSIAQTSVAVQRVQDLLKADAIIPERPDATDPPPFRGDIAYEHVTFGYRPDTPVLRDINFTVQHGELLGIVGATGTGKSTAVSLISRFYDVNSGTIRIDGADIRDFKLRGLRNQIAFVLQDTVLFRGTVRDNIAVGCPNATKDEIVQAAKLANADEFITRMPRGYDSIVGERGLRLSAGQRQRIGIARALIRNNPILILDEPSAALDAESEQVVLEALERLMKDRTVICIAHRLSTIRDANKIIAFKDGAVVEEGTHQELLARDGVYAELHRIQYRQESA
jgi:ABC-type multidrug transport system fused ATPase/permease subunit